jgi:hypothetical protein
MKEPTLKKLLFDMLLFIFKDLLDFLKFENMKKLTKLFFHILLFFFKELLDLLKDGSTLTNQLDEDVKDKRSKEIERKLYKIQLFLFVVMFFFFILFVINLIVGSGFCFTWFSFFCWVSCFIFSTLSILTYPSCFDEMNLDKFVDNLKI